jgi:hypothetical protein
MVHFFIGLNFFLFETDFPDIVEQNCVLYGFHLFLFPKYEIVRMCRLIIRRLFVTNISNETQLYCDDTIVIVLTVAVYP